MADITPNNPLGKDGAKGGYFFNTNLTPAGTFPNLPTYTNFVPPTTQQQRALVLTLEQVKEGLRKSAAAEQGTTSEDVLSDQSINTYLTEFVQLLIDYQDLRNYVFFGSSYTELVYHINTVIETYPYKSFFARDYNIALSTITLQSISGGKTRIGFTNADIYEQSIFTYDASGATLWTNYDIVDKNGTRFPIVSINEPSNVTNVTFLLNTITITTADVHNLQTGELVTISGVNGIPLANTTAAITVTSPTSFTYTVVGPTGVYTGGGTVVANDIHIIVEGNVSSNNLIEYEPTVTELFKGLIVSPKIKALNDFEVNLPGEQKALLSPLNPTPWPRNPITDNIVTEGITFDTWIESSTNMVPPINGDDLGILNVDGEALNLRGALSLDEQQTNQLIRRAIPDKLVDELNDPDDKMFTRFILIAGRFFDNIKVYIDFLKYVHSLNYTPFNQLSPEFYKNYAQHFGFDLFDDDSVDLAKAIVTTEPGLRYDISDNAVFDNSATAKTVQELQNEKQKRLLLNLLHLYKTKGTQRSIRFLTSLLGAPEGLIVLDEFMFNQESGLKEINNEKYHVPTMGYEIDPQYLKDPTNIFNPINLPYVYRLKLDNEHQINLRELKIATDPQGAIAQQVVEFGKTIYPYALFRQGSFANLQEKNKPYLLLPLNFPDKFTGLTIEYMIPKGGYPQLEADNLDEVTMHLGSLYEVDSVSFSGTNLVPITPAGIYQYTYPMPAQLLDDSTTYPTTQWQNQICDLTGVEAPSIITRDSVANELNYIIVRLEGKDLVVRAQLRNEKGIISSVSKKVAIFRNVFESDGLNHQLRLIYRPEGVEVYQDFVYRGLARWMDPTDGFVTYEPIDAPKSLFDSFIVSPIPNLFAFPNKDTSGVSDEDFVKWFDLMVGLPQNIEMYIGRVAVFDSIGIEVPDVLDFGLALSGIENEKFSFSLQDQTLNGTAKEKDFISVKCTYRAANPDVITTNTIVEDYFNLITVNNKISTLNLSSKNYKGGDAQYVEDVQGFYKMPNGVTLTVDNLFTYNAWSPTIHKDYNYDSLYNEAYHNYESFSAQVLTYLSLIPFIELVEQKFQGLIKQFIPIVINLGEFGRLLRNNPFNQSKAHYHNIHFICDGTTYNDNSLGFFDLMTGTYNSGVNYLEVVIGLEPAIQQDWISTNAYTLTQLANQLNVAFGPALTATATYDNLTIIIDPDIWQTQQGYDITNYDLIVNVFGDVTISNKVGFIGGGEDLIGTCDKFVVTRTTAIQPEITPSYPYIYYASENGPITYIYFDSEGFPPLYLD